MSFEADLALIRDAAHAAGALASRMRDAGLTIEMKAGDSPVTDADLAVRAQYKTEAENHPGVVFGGRLGAYAYLDMENTISTALDTFAALKSKLHAGR